MFRRLGVLAFLITFGTAHATGPRDPMRPYDAPRLAKPAAASPQPLELTAVFLGKDRRVAVLNKRLYKVGDRIRNYELAAIDAWSVTLRRGDTTRRLKLRGATPPVSNSDPSGEDS